MSDEQGRRRCSTGSDRPAEPADGATWTDSFDFTYRPAATPRSPAEPWRSRAKLSPNRAGAHKRAMSAAPYVPLRIFSCYTMLEGAIEPKAIAKQAKRAAASRPSALTDRNGLYAAMPFTDACLEEGVQPIVGAMLGVARPAPGRRRRGRQAAYDRLAAALCAGRDGLSTISARWSRPAHLDRPVEQDAACPARRARRAHRRADRADRRRRGRARAAARRGPGATPSAMLEAAEALFPGRLYIELSRRGDAIEQAAEEALIELAYARDLPLVATNPAAYAEAHFHAAHDAMLCIAQSSQIDRDDRLRSSPEAWIKPAPTMRALFADLPEAIDNTAVIARRCAFGAPQRKPILPSTRRRSRGARPSSFAATRAPAWTSGLRHYEDLTEAERQIYADRLDFEIDVIAGMGFPGYFLIVADFIKWAKEQDIPVGPGRGSGAGSVVAWSLTITDLDPIRLGLLFERFLNPERVSMPDFDIDFCETRRGEVIRYVQERYGADKVAQIITFGKLKARAVLKDTGRVLQMPYGQVDRLAKLIPNHPTDPWTLERALNGVSELAAEYKRRPRGPPPVRPGDEAGRPAAPHLDPCRRRGDRRPAARPARPALPRSALGHAGHPVRHEICRGGGAGEVRLPRPQDAVRAAEGGRRCSAQRGVEVDLDRLAVGRSGGLRAAPARRHGRRVPARIGRHAAHAGGGEADQFRRHHRARLALPAGPDGQYPDVRRPQERPRADRISASSAREAAEGNLRHLRLSGTGDGGGADPRRLQPRRGRSAAPRDGQEDQVGDGRAARSASSPAASGSTASRRPRPTNCST